MGNVSIPGPSLTYVSWSCQRCGHVGGVARTTFPIDPDWTEEMGRVLFKTLREKLVRVHQRHSQDIGKCCIPIPDDFVIGPYVPPGKTVAGVV